eukprot:CAMPEP_0172587688 /NCGR_PEP_ID=MMETSP1068-20121228/6701_1 /TAXON_ID=35684 /ORGANISM="Pseudopedinella elastica, Strain CCMP716" /LENGTH=253 /DNA_ID=CAMNT_0013382785 /DNA_START=304 /DNA_END=1065 /DNA_ORIENTATION=+
MSTAKMGAHVTHTEGDVTTITHFTISYKDFTALEFTLIMAILEWLWTIFLISVMISSQVMNLFTESPKFRATTQIGNAVFCLAAFTSAVACSSVSSDCTSGGNGLTLAPFPPRDPRADAVDTFCAKVGASCTFVWFMGIALVGALGLRADLLSSHLEDGWAPAHRPHAEAGDAEKSGWGGSGLGVGRGGGGEGGGSSGGGGVVRGATWHSEEADFFSRPTESTHHGARSRQESDSSLRSADLGSDGVISSADL